MKAKNKIITVSLLLTSTAACIYAINKLIKASATSLNVLGHSTSHTFKWRLGDVRYRKSGTGAPVVLLHDLHFASGSFEWSKLIPILTSSTGERTSYTVFAPDLIGCATSEKPEMTFTNYLYVQMLCSFISCVIGEKASIIATGNSVPIAIMACRSNPELFDKLVFISPPSIESGYKMPSKLAKTYKFIVNTPILGTLLYNMASSKDSIARILGIQNFLDPAAVSTDILDAYYEAAHLGQYPKSLYASTICNYTKANFKTALADLDHNISIISGRAAAGASQNAEDYTQINPSIEVAILDNCRRLPQLECPHALADQLSIFLA